MTFSEALEELKKGKKIKRKDWGGYWFYLGFAENKLFIGNIIDVGDWIIAKLANGGYAPAQAYQSDLLAEDWEVVE